MRNPYRQDWITRYELDPDVVDCISFCTKNPAPMLQYLDELSRFNQYWFVTITPYGKDIEPNVPPKEQVMQLSEVLLIYQRRNHSDRNAAAFSVLISALMIPALISAVIVTPIQAERT